MDLTMLLIAVFAVMEINEIWRHGSIFAGWRAVVQSWEGKLGSLLDCPFCLSPWIAWFVVLPPLLMLDTVYSPTWLAEVGKIWRWIVYGFAVARVANIGNDVFYDYCRTPRASRIADGVTE